MQLIKSDQKKNLLPLFAVGTFSLHLFTLLLLLFHGSMLQQLRRQLTPQSLVQLVDGRAITVDPNQSEERYPETIRRFVGQTMSLMFTWSEKQPPSTVWQISSQLLSDDFWRKFAPEFNPDQSNSIPGGTENILIIESISQPTPVKRGEWQVTMIAHRVTFTNSDSLGKSVPFNKRIFVRAIAQQPVTLPNKPLSWHLSAYRLGEARLEIYNICELEDKTCSAGQNEK